MTPQPTTTTPPPEPTSPVPSSSSLPASSDGAKGVAGLKYGEGVGGNYREEGSGSKQQRSESAFTAKPEHKPEPKPKANNDSSVDAAPGYMANVVSNPAQSGKPKGKNITEGGFEEDDDKNVSFGAEIGGEDDPGRVAEGEMQRRTQASSGSSAPRQGLVGVVRRGE